MNKGRLITLEGGEGAGKTTALKTLCKILDDWGIEYICTREPGGEKIAEKIRDILLNSEYLHPKTELLLMFASRNEHIENVIKPNLNSGIWVVSDRYVDASYAYQGGGRELGFENVKWLDDFIVGDIQADLTILMDIDPKIGMQRVQSRGSADRIEKESMPFFYKIAKAYRNKAEQDPSKYAIIDAAASIEQVSSDIGEALIDHKNRLL
jgi:dTMP kinase